MDSAIIGMKALHVYLTPDNGALQRVWEKTYHPFIRDCKLLFPPYDIF
jgi:hypothetical protein